MYDFFLSFTEENRRIADVVRTCLANSGYSCFYQFSSIEPGANFVQRISEGLEESDVLIALFSPAYFSSDWAQTELHSAFADDPGNRRESIVPLLIQDADIPRPFNTLDYVDCRLLSDAQLVERLQRDVISQYQPGSTRAEDPRVPETNTPGVAQKLLDDLEMSYQIFVSQCEVRDQLVAAMRERNPRFAPLQYEAFLERYWNEMTAGEKRLHDRLREHSRTLEKLNRRALYYVEANSEFRKHISDLARLRSHLRAWLDKFDERFESNPHVGVVYVGVEEKQPFPTGVNAQIENYIQTSSTA